MNKHSIVSILLMLALRVFAQHDSSSRYTFCLNGFSEGYSNYYNSGDNTLINRQFLYNYSHADIANINLVMLKAKIEGSSLRSSLALMAGTYAINNLAHEPRWTRHIYEAHAGVRLVRNYDLWIEAGVFESYIGHETPIGSNHPTLSRSLAAENSPYYLNGSRLMYETPDNKWLLSIYFVSGWQQMTWNQVSGVHLGAHLQYKPSGKWLINYSNFMSAGNQQTISNTSFSRMFHDLYVVFKPNDKCELRALYDYGIAYNIAFNGIQSWQVMNAMMRYQFSKNWASSARLEFLHNPQAVFLLSNLINPKLNYLCGASINIDWLFNNGFMLRNELKYLTSNDMVFNDVFNKTRHQLMGITSICYQF
jgi:hypothetical protein